MRCRGCSGSEREIPHQKSQAKIRFPNPMWVPHWRFVCRGVYQHQPSCNNTNPAVRLLSHVRAVQRMPSSDERSADCPAISFFVFGVQGKVRVCRPVWCVFVRGGCASLLAFDSRKKKTDNTDSR